MSGLINPNNVYQQIIHKDGGKEIKTVKLLLMDNVDNKEFDLKAYMTRHDMRVKNIRSDDNLSTPQKEEMLDFLQQSCNSVKSSIKVFAVGRDEYSQRGGTKYRNEPWRRNISRLFLGNGSHFVVKYLHPKDRELKVLNKLDELHIQIRDLIDYKVMHAIEKETSLLRGMSGSKQLQTRRGWYIPVVMPLYDGELSNFINKRSTNFDKILQKKDIVQILLQVAKVFQELMDREFYYTDVKPANLLYRKVGNRIHVVVADLGGMVFNDNSKLEFVPQTFPLPHKNFQKIDLYKKYVRKRQDFLQRGGDQKNMERLNQWYKKEFESGYYHNHHSPKGEVNYNSPHWQVEQRNKLEHIVVWGLGVVGLLLFMTQENKEWEYSVILGHDVLSYSNPEFYKHDRYFRPLSNQKPPVKSVPGYREFVNKLPISRVYRTIPRVIKDIIESVQKERMVYLNGVIRRLEDSLKAMEVGSSSSSMPKSHRFVYNRGDNRDGSRVNKKRRWRSNSMDEEEEKRRLRKLRFSGGGELVLRKGTIKLRK